MIIRNKAHLGQKIVQILDDNNKIVFQGSEADLQELVNTIVLESHFSRTETTASVSEPVSEEDKQELTTLKRKITLLEKRVKELVTKIKDLEPGE